MLMFVTNFRKAIDFSKFIWYNNICCETLAQPVEHTPFKRRVEGSNPSCLTILGQWNRCSSKNPLFIADFLRLEAKKLRCKTVDAFWHFFQWYGIRTLDMKTSVKNQSGFEKNYLISAFLIHKILHKLWKTVLSNVTNFKWR